ncbi:MAG: hypothetical protein PF545_03190 [Elusimicrobia bacterium]|jgi:hypothetical protein|nr:hypothetical protein [Elusimicrobiota bacterium]
MTKKTYTKICASFEELEKAADEHDFSLTPRQRLDMTQYLREQYYELKGIKPRKMNRKYAKKISIEDLRRET